MGLDWECRADMSCSAWALTYFKDCVCNASDLVSFVLGMTSIICWGVAEIPQIFENWKLSDTENVSLAFILTWMIGDIFNLVGCWINPATVIFLLKRANSKANGIRYLASYAVLHCSDDKFHALNDCDGWQLYTATTAILVVQHIWYAWRTQLLVPTTPGPSVLNRSVPEVSSPRWSSSRNSLDGLFPSDPCLRVTGSIPLSGSQSKRGGRPPLPVPSSLPLQAHTGPLPSPQSYSGSWRRMTMSSSIGTFGSSPKTKGLIFSSLVIVSLRFGSYTLFGEQRQPRGDLLSSRRKLLQVISPAEDVTRSVGLILGWLMTCIYLTGRLPQVILNWTRDFVIGVSMTQVIFAFLGNATYLGSILVRTSKWSTLSLNLPWIVDITCCVLMDLFVSLLRFPSLGYVLCCTLRCCALLLSALIHSVFLRMKEFHTLLWPFEPHQMKLSGFPGAALP